MTATGRPAGWMVGVGTGSLHTMQDKTVLALPVLVRNQTGKAQDVRFDQQWKLQDVPSGKYFPLVAPTPSLRLQPGDQGCVLLYFAALSGAGTSPCPFLNGGLLFYPVTGGSPSYGFLLHWPCKHQADPSHQVVETPPASFTLPGAASSPLGRYVWDGSSGQGAASSRFFRLV
jgi:hypothetical protein